MAEPIRNEKPEKSLKSIETPLSEITLRRYEKPYNLSKRDLVCKLCLSVGLLQPGDSRDVIIDILYVLLKARKQKKELSSFEVREQVVLFRRELNLPLLGIADSNVRRQLKRLRDLFLIEKVKNNYRVTEFESLENIFTAKVEQYLFPTILQRVKEYVIATDLEFTDDTQKS
jgi:DNA-binding transcriptional ArsR family regulator